MFWVRVIRTIERIAHGERDLSLSVERMGIATHDFQILIERALTSFVRNGFSLASCLPAEQPLETHRRDA